MQSREQAAGNDAKKIKSESFYQYSSETCFYIDHLPVCKYCHQKQSGSFPPPKPLKG